MTTFVFGLAITGCGRSGVSALPAEGPDVVVKQFYERVSKATTEGGSASARFAFELISSDRSQLRVEEFLEIIKKYPRGLVVDVGKAEVNGAHALVDISYKMPSLFNDGYTVREVIPLNLDEDESVWRVDFTGETYGMDKAAAATLAEEQDPAMLEVGL